MLGSVLETLSLSTRFHRPTKPDSSNALSDSIGLADRHSEPMTVGQRTVQNLRWPTPIIVRVRAALVLSILCSSPIGQSNLLDADAFGLGQNVSGLRCHLLDARPLFPPSPTIPHLALSI